MGSNLHNSKVIVNKKIAIFVDTEKSSGGAFHELLFFIKSFEKYCSKHELEFVIIRSDKKIFDDNFTSKFKILDFKLNAIQRYLHFVFNYHHFFRRIRGIFRFKNKFEQFLQKANIDQVIFTGPSQYALYVEKTPYGIIIPDVALRENVEFPELSSNPEFVRKDEVLSKALPRASYIITNSEIIKKRISFFYKILMERILIVSQQPSDYIRNFNIEKNLVNIQDYRKKKALPEQYIFYPAMYFPHKNHKLIIDAIQILSKKNIKLSAVFCGKDKGYKDNLKNYCNEKKISERIIFLNFVKEEELPYLYCNSLALVMPSLIGPTNIPPWEAFKLKVPVFYPDFGGIKTILKDAVHYIDSFDPNILAEGLQKILSDEKFKGDMIKNGEQLYNSIETSKEFDIIFNRIKHIRNIRLRWIF